MVQGVHPIVSQLLASEGAITVGRHPRLRSTLNRLSASGVLASPLPGVYVPRGDDPDAAWLRAVCAWAGPRGALHAETAMALHLPTTTGGRTQLAHPTLRSRHRIRVWRQRVPPEFVRWRDGIRFASPAYAAVELAATDDGRAVCEVLRRGLATTDELADAVASLALTSGQAVRRCVVAECMANPWSYAELRLQRILRAAGITGWVANEPLLLQGRDVHPDVLFPEARLVIEFDGREVHNDPAQFLRDRERQNLLVAQGYRIVRFGWEHLDDPEYVVRTVVQALRAAELGRPGRIRHDAC